MSTSVKILVNENARQVGNLMAWLLKVAIFDQLFP